MDFIRYLVGTVAEYKMWSGVQLRTTEGSAAATSTTAETIQTRLSSPVRRVSRCGLESISPGQDRLVGVAVAWSRCRPPQVLSFRVRRQRGSGWAASQLTVLTLFTDHQLRGALGPVLSVVI